MGGYRWDRADSGPPIPSEEFYGFAESKTTPHPISPSRCAHVHRQLIQPVLCYPVREMGKEEITLAHYCNIDARPKPPHARAKRVNMPHKKAWAGHPPSGEMGRTAVRIRQALARRSRTRIVLASPESQQSGRGAESIEGSGFESVAAAPYNLRWAILICLAFLRYFSYLERTRKHLPIGKENTNN